VEFDEKEALEDQVELMKVSQVVKIKMSENGTTEMFDEYKKQKRNAVGGAAEKKQHLKK